MSSQTSLFKKRVYSVSAVNDYAKSLLTGDPILNDIWIRGEVSNLKRHSSGHVYFTIKDGDASLRCAYFRQNAQRGVRLSDGMQALVRGYITIYTRDGSYQMVVQEAEADGEGALFALFQKRKEELAAKGYFDESNKKPLPFLPKRIAVVTSPTGAVLRDIARVARNRWPGVSLLLVPASVQGEGAAEQIARAIGRAEEAADVEVIIVGRGGGSIEDLWAFNEMCVAEAIFACKQPVVSAVGHETDFTLADFCADVRASTPTHAAELCVPDVFAVQAHVESLLRRAARNQRMFMDICRQRVSVIADRPVLKKPEAFLNLLRERCGALHAHAGKVMGQIIGENRAAVKLLSEKAEALGPGGVLRRGYAVIQKNGGVVTGVGGLEGDVAIMMFDGTKNARVLNE